MRRAVRHILPRRQVFNQPTDAAPVKENLSGWKTENVVPGDLVTQTYLDAMTPSMIRIKRHNPFVPLLPHDVDPHYTKELYTKPSDPGHVLDTYNQYQYRADPSYEFLTRCFVQLGYIFDQCSFWATADRQRVHSSRLFKNLMYDLSKRSSELKDADVPAILHAMTATEYRCRQLLPRVLDIVAARIQDWRCETLCSLIYSLAYLNVGVGENNLLEGKDYSGLLERLILELSDRYGDVDDGNLHDWAQVSFAMVMHGLYDLEGRSGPVLPQFLAKACQFLDNERKLNSSGWAQFFIYQSLYCIDVEKPACEMAAKTAVPFWVQRQLHLSWLQNILMLSQPQGSDDLQASIDAALNRTNTKALVNISVGREQDEQHCWFAGHRIDPGWAIEGNSMMPIAPGVMKPSGWLALKSRMLRNFGLKVVTIHNSIWSKLSDDQKDDQIMKLRTTLGYTRSAVPDDVMPRTTPYGPYERHWGPRWKPQAMPEGAKM